MYSNQTEGLLSKIGFGAGRATATAEKGASKIGSFLGKMKQDFKSGYQYGYHTGKDTMPNAFNSLQTRINQKVANMPTSASINQQRQDRLSAYAQRAATQPTQPKPAQVDTKTDAPLAYTRFTPKRNLPVRRGGQISPLRGRPDAQMSTTSTDTPLAYTRFTPKKNLPVRRGGQISPLRTRSDAQMSTTSRAKSNLTTDRPRPASPVQQTRPGMSKYVPSGDVRRSKIQRPGL